MDREASGSTDKPDMQRWYAERGFGGRVGFGERPALVVIDMAKAWLDDNSPLGSERVRSIVPRVVELLDWARRVGIPVFFTTMEYDEDLDEAGNVCLRKLSNWRSLIRGSEWTQLDPRLQRRKHEVLIKKQRASAFFGTTFLAHLMAKKVDTLIIAGCSTSGCVRATAESSFDFNLHTIVVRDAVADRSREAHEWNLFDIDNRYADVVSLEEVEDHMRANLRT